MVARAEPAHPRLLPGRGPGRPSLRAVPPGPLWRDARAALVHPRTVRMSRLDPSGAYAELATASNFSFLRGASHPKDLVLTAILRRHAGLGLADRHTVAGVVRAWGARNEMRVGGLAPPDRMRGGGSPGEIAFIEDPLNDQALSEEVKRRAADFRLLTGTRLVFNDGTPDVIAYPETRAGWGQLTRLLTLGNRRARKGECEIGL